MHERLYRSDYNHASIKEEKEHKKGYKLLVQYFVKTTLFE